MSLVDTTSSSSPVGPRRSGRPAKRTRAFSPPIETKRSTRVTPLVDETPAESSVEVTPRESVAVPKVEPETMTPRVSAPQRNPPATIRILQPVSRSALNSTPATSTSTRLPAVSRSTDTSVRPNSEAIYPVPPPVSNPESRSQSYDPMGTYGTPDMSPSHKTYIPPFDKFEAYVTKMATMPVSRLEHLGGTNDTRRMIRHMTVDKLRFLGDSSRVFNDFFNKNSTFDDGVNSINYVIPKGTSVDHCELSGAPWDTLLETREFIDENRVLLADYTKLDQCPRKSVNELSESFHTASNKLNESCLSQVTLLLIADFAKAVESFETKKVSAALFHMRAIESGFKLFAINVATQKAAPMNHLFLIHGLDKQGLTAYMILMRYACNFNEDILEIVSQSLDEVRLANILRKFFTMPIVDPYESVFSLPAATLIPPVQLLINVEGVGSDYCGFSTGLISGLRNYGCDLCPITNNCKPMNELLEGKLRFPEQPIFTLNIMMKPTHTISTLGSVAYIGDLKLAVVNNDDRVSSGLKPMHFAQSHISEVLRLSIYGEEDLITESLLARHALTPGAVIILYLEAVTGHIAEYLNNVV